MKDLVLCGIKNTKSLVIEATSDITMVIGMIIDIIQKFQYEFSL